MAVIDDEKRLRLISKFWNSERGEFCGRDGLGWLFLGAFYLGLYLFLIVFFVGNLALFFETLDTTEPKWFGVDSLTQDNPGIGMRPLPVYDTTLLRFEQGKPSSYKPYTDHLEAFLIPYKNELQQGRNIITCSVNVGAKKEDGKTCRVDLDEVLGQCTQEKDFGYEDGEPCILLKMNKVFNFVPIPYGSVDELVKDNDLPTAPRFLAFSPNLTVGIGCEGENAADRENLQDIVFYPNVNYQGIPIINFPYVNQEGHRSPFIMAKFKRFTKRVVIQIVCRLYAKNINNSGTARRHGTLRFELLKD